MGRTRASTAADTRERLPRTADVLARRGSAGTGVPDLVEAAGPGDGALPAHSGSRATLPADAPWVHRRRLVAVRRDDDVVPLVRAPVQERAAWLADTVRRGRADGGIDAAPSPHAVAHLCLLLAAGTALVGPDVDPVDDAEWTALVARPVAGLAPARTADAPGSRP
ncbi:hypothetical protein JD79_02984 [Geodermatophilus normandii]|uniref:TetR family transcriptional regulator n=1 Tax=Geodermatophilus normandii TaxID=1137989 RepID=A0A317QJD2_9ACTN|nr:hypothetical protein [Geodermatophilus normandii]PWW23808.1 hypothetical protein JD79_02984 [Geodermatophilus normandii]